MVGTPERKNNTAIWIVIYLAILATTTCLGLLVGFVYYRVCPAKYRSDATFLVDRHPAGLGHNQLQHEELILHPEFIKTVLESNQLYSLRCFDDLPTEEALQHTLANLEVVPNPNVPEIYSVRLFSNRPNDAQTIVTNLLASYAKKLEQTELPVPESESDPPITQPNQETDARQLAELEFFKTVSKSGLVPNPELKILEPATFGEPVWPVLPIILLVSGGVGILAGFAIIVAIFLKSKAMSLKDNAAI